MFSITGLLFVCLIYRAHGLPDTQIVGGTDAPDGQYPYQVSLKRPSGSHFCGGAIVSKRYVITAAHCLNNLYNNPSNVLIDVGSNYLYFPTIHRITYTVETIIPHPSYNKTLQINDIGLIKLTKDIKFNKNIKSIALISYDANFDGVDFIVTGWGRLWQNGPVPERLQQIMVKGFSQSMCVRMYRNITNGHICTFQAPGQGMCNGDSGGALTLKGELVGIVSFGIPCATGVPDVFTRVYHYKSWVNKYINAGSNQQLNIFLGLFTTYLCIHSFL